VLRGEEEAHTTQHQIYACNYRFLIYTEIRKTITTERDVGMRKKGIVLLLILGVLLLVGCEDESKNAITPLEVCKIATEWGERTPTEPGISFLLDGDKSALEIMDIILTDGPPREGYTVTVLSTKGNIITGTYHYDDGDPENPEYDITLTLFYKAPKLTVKITGKGPLANKTYVVEPTPES